MLFNSIIDWVLSEAPHGWFNTHFDASYGLLIFGFDLRDNIITLSKNYLALLGINEISAKLWQSEASSIQL